MQLRWRGHLDTLKPSSKRLQINPTNWEDFAHDRATWRWTVKTGAAIYEANRIAAAKVKRESHKSQLRLVRNADAQPLPTCPRCQRTFRVQIGLIGHLWTNCTSRTASKAVPPPASSSSSLPPTNSDYSSVSPLPSSSSSYPSSSSSSSSSSSPFTALTTAALASVAHNNTTHTPDTTTDITPAISDSGGEDQDYVCPRCDRTFTSHVGLVGHLRIHRTQTGEPVPGAPSTSTALASTAHTALAPSRIAWAYSATCASTRVELTAVSSHLPHLTHPPCPAPPSLHRPVSMSPPPPPPPPPPL
ncbi:hypothetical protein SprV_0602215300 [Sparganum proliferum]